MYSERELIRLAAHKRALLVRIDLRRRQSAGAFAGVVRPLVWLDRALAWWRKASPLVQLAAVPLGLVARRTLFPRAKFLGRLVSWGPAAFGLVRALIRPRS